ncbi:MAG TPA: hypothetical protein VK856_14985, partial [Anaerolineaceae bacterium]|nr:hypothetical protein [Anaerolineaceae bacterium]
MYPTKFNPKDPFSLILSQDTRSAKDIPAIDNVWEIQFDSGEFGGISLFSTLSLRALGLRITPIFSSQGENRIDITQFSSEPQVQSLCPDYAKIHAEVFPSILMNMEYWVPNSYMISGVINIVNSSNKKFEGDVQYIVNLKPVEIGKIMTGLQSDRHFFLEGRTKNLAPIFYLSGNAHTGKYGQSSIETNFQIGSDEVHKIEWCLTFLDDIDSSIVAIKNMNNHDFEKQAARIELNTQSERFLISSGKPDWDKAILASQHAATQLIISNTYNDHISLVDSLHPEKTIFSQLPPANQLSEGISPLQLWYFSQVLPGQSNIILDSLLEFFENQTEDGFIPNHSNPENYQYKFHAFPIFARIAYLMLIHIENQELVKQIFQNLVLYLQKWLNVDQLDSSPHWTNSIQSLYENLPIHNFLNQNGNPVHTRWIQSPFLITLLLQEIEYCLKISNHVSMDFPEKEWLQEQKFYLGNQLKNLWDTKLKIFRYKDIQTKRLSRRYRILSINQSGEFQVGKNFKNSERISLKISSNKEFSRNTTVNISGFLKGKEISESFVPRQFEWNHTIGYATS